MHRLSGNIYRDTISPHALSYTGECIIVHTHSHIHIYSLAHSHTHTHTHTHTPAAQRMVSIQCWVIATSLVFMQPLVYWGWGSWPTPLTPGSWTHSPVRPFHMKVHVYSTPVVEWNKKRKERKDMYNVCTYTVYDVLAGPPTYITKYGST